MSLLKNRFFPVPTLALLATIILLALAVRLIYLVLVVGPSSYPTNIDSIEHHLIATNIVNGQGYSMYGHPTAYRAPFLTYYMALCYQLFGPNFLVVRLGIIILSLILIRVIYCLGKEVFGSRVGLWSALISAIYPHLIFYNARIFTETPFTLFSLAALLFFIRFNITGLWKYLILTALFLALTILTRPVGLALWFFMLAFLFFKNRFWRKVKPVIVLGTFTIAFISPWIIRNYQVFNQFVPVTTQGGVVLWVSNNHYIAHHPYYRGMHCLYQHLPGAANLITYDEVVRSYYSFQYFRRFLKEYPEDISKLVLNKVSQFWIDLFSTSSSRRWMYEYSYLLLLFTSIGGLIVAHRSWNKQVIYLWMLLLANFIPAVIFWAGARIRLPAEPVLIVFSALFIEKIQAWIFRIGR